MTFDEAAKTATNASSASGLMMDMYEE